VCFLATNNNNTPNKASTIANPYAAPFGINKKYAIENMMHVNACNKYVND
jgi:hypothetical protein